MFLEHFFCCKSKNNGMKKNKLPAVKKSVKSRYIRFFRKKLHDGTFFLYL